MQYEVITLLNGESQTQETIAVTVPEDKAIVLTQVPVAALPDSTFLYVSWTDQTQTHSGHTCYFPERYKAYDLPEADVRAHWVEGARGA